MITFENVKFDAQGASKTDKVFALTLSGSEDVEIKNCEFANMGYSSILNNCSGNVAVRDCVFNCENVKNPIEGGQFVANGNVSVENCQFKAVPGNNYINFYKFAEGSHHEIRGCYFEPDMGTNCVRISNVSSAKADFVISDCDYAYPVDGEPNEDTAFILCQDYAAEGGLMDFTKLTVVLDNVRRDGKALTADSEYVLNVYDNQDGYVSDRGPVVKF